MSDWIKNSRMTPALLRAVVVFSLVVIITLASIFVSYIYLDDVHSEQMSANRAMRTWQSKINHSVENNQIIDEFENNFIKLVNQGVVGEEERLSWFETVQNTARKRGMPSVRYSVSSQRALDLENLKTEFPSINVYKSVMTLNVKMGHEGDLFALLNDLEKANGLYAVDRCDIEKISQKEQDGTTNMKAYCELGWYTFRNAAKDTGNNGEG